MNQPTQPAEEAKVAVPPAPPSPPPEHKAEGGLGPPIHGDPEVVIGPWWYRWLEDRECAWRVYCTGALDQYRGMWAAFLNGQFLGADPSPTALEQRVGQEHHVPPESVYTLYVE